MIFNINKDFFDNDKLLIISGLSGVGKTSFILKLINNLKYNVMYLDINNCVRRIEVENYKILNIYTYDDIISEINKYKNCTEKTIIVADQINNIIEAYKTRNAKLFNLLKNCKKLQDENKNIKFIFSITYYNDAYGNLKLPSYITNFYSNIINIIKIESYADVVNFKMLKQIRNIKLKRIL